MFLRFADSVPKRRGPERNEDAAEGHPYRGIYAMSDGASESYAPALWARLVTKRFLTNQRVDAAWLRTACGLFASHFDRESMSWSAQAAYDRGSFATLLGLRFTGAGRRAEVLAIGDSLAVLVDGEAVIDSFPYAEADEFRQNPLLISTLMERNADVQNQLLSGSAHRCWDLSSLPKPRILCMTDALGAWLLEDRRERLPILLSLRTKLQFRSLVDAERAAGRMRRDDTTLLVFQ
ncbi:hypothetical protein [Azospirillum argentinense]|uniref:Protein phosphatase 2C domain-containing protein n=1 Tax=Azospirillum argentinense TaxID=2970906 RepID=A0A5B0KMY0_9PROT|nr:hypothetical protein [Azospirillum argentinense]KAA1053166.1 hypothetical protein FH063_003085 [Azospirillum argentinense]